MPEYLSPDVFVEEKESDRHTIERLSTSTAGFIGVAEKGPIGEPVLITSFAQFRRVFGGFIAQGHLAYAVEGFFKIIRGRCFVVRTAHYADPSDPTTLTAAAASVTILDRPGTPHNTLKVDALSPGAWGNTVSVVISPSSRDSATRFKLTVLKNGAALEPFDDLSMDEASEDHVEKRINGVSEYISVEDLDSVSSAPFDRPREGAFPLVGGDDGLVDLDDDDFLGDPLVRTGVHAFDPIDEVSIFCAPGITTQAMQQGILTYAELRQDLFVILDPPVGMDIMEIKAYVQDTAAFNSRFGGMYYPNLIIRDPLTGNNKIMAPSGQLSGIFARTDAVRGVFKAPAGIDDGRFVDVLGVEFDIDKGQRDILYPARINCIVKKRGVGVVAWGNRTLSPLSDWRSINVRRLFTHVIESIAEGTEWAVFRPNNQDLWSDLNTTLNVFLKEYWREGAFYDGGTGEFQDACYVKCDADLNPQSVIDQYRVVCDIGLAPTKAAEFVVFRITQWDGGRLVEEVAGQGGI